MSKLPPPQQEIDDWDDDEWMTPFGIVNNSEILHNQTVVQIDTVDGDTHMLSDAENTPISVTTARVASPEPKDISMTSDSAAPPQDTSNLEALRSHNAVEDEHQLEAANTGAASNEQESIASESQLVPGKSNDDSMTSVQQESEPMNVEDAATTIDRSNEQQSMETESQLDAHENTDHSTTPEQKESEPMTVEEAATTTVTLNEQQSMSSESRLIPGESTDDSTTPLQQESEPMFVDEYPVQSPKAASSEIEDVRLPERNMLEHALNLAEIEQENDVSSNEASTQFQICQRSYSEGFKAGMCHAAMLVTSAAVGAENMIAALSANAETIVPSETEQPISKGKKRKMSEHTEAPPKKKSVTGKERVSYTKEDDATLLRIAQAIVKNDTTISRNKLFHKVHEQCGLERTFYSIETRMKNVIMKKLDQNQENEM